MLTAPRVLVTLGLLGCTRQPAPEVVPTRQLLTAPTCFALAYGTFRTYGMSTVLSAYTPSLVRFDTAAAYPVLGPPYLTVQDSLRDELRRTLVAWRVASGEGMNSRMR